MITLTHYLVLGALLFGISDYGAGVPQPTND